MSTPLHEYHVLIDRLVNIRPGHLSEAVREERFRHCWREKDEQFSRFIEELTPAQRELLARMLDHARDTAIMDLLACLRDEIATQALRLSRHGVPLPVEPHHVLNSDWWCRCQGEPWPEREGEGFTSAEND
jgi:hypothetical protein